MFSNLLRHSLFGLANGKDHWQWTQWTISGYTNKSSADCASLCMLSAVDSKKGPDSPGNVSTQFLSNFERFSGGECTMSMNVRCTQTECTRQWTSKWGAGNRFYVRKMRGSIYELLRNSQRDVCWPSALEIFKLFLFLLTNLFRLVALKNILFTEFACKCTTIIWVTPVEHNGQRRVKLDLEPDEEHCWIDHEGIV